MIPSGGVKGFLDQLLSQGQGLAQQGEDAAASQLGYGDSEGDRSRMRNTALASGAAAGVLGLLLGSKKGRKLAKKAVVYGGIGVLGKLAYDAYTNRGGREPQAPQVAQLEGPAAEKRAVSITRALIAAAKADGHIDAEERRHIEEALGQLPASVAALLREELDRPLDPEGIAKLADSDQAAREIFLASLIVRQDDDPDERAYLDRLATALRLYPDTVEELRREAKLAPGAVAGT